MEQTRNKTDIAFTVSGRLAVSCAVAYMALPTILFLLGWVRPLFSVPAAAAVAAAAVLLSATIPAPTLHFTRRQMAIYLCVLVLSLLWLLAGGMTGITSQHADFVVRNPIYETLIRCDWPLVDAGGRPFIYYLAFWLPPALACKCLSCGTRRRPASITPLHLRTLSPWTFPVTRNITPSATASNGTAGILSTGPSSGSWSPTP